MATVDARLDVAAFENVTRFQLAQGVKVNLRLRRDDADYVGPVETAATGDQVLDIVDGNEPGVDEVEITAKEVGESRFFFIQKNENPESFDIVKQVRIKVVEKVEAMATNLNLSAEAEDKQGI